MDTLTTLPVIVHSGKMASYSIPFCEAVCVVSIVIWPSCFYMCVIAKFVFSAGSPRKWGLDMLWAECQPRHQVLLWLWEHCGKDCYETVCQQYQEGVCLLLFNITWHEQQGWLTQLEHVTTADAALMLYNHIQTLILVIIYDTLYTHNHDLSHDCASRRAFLFLPHHQ